MKRFYLFLIPIILFCGTSTSSVYDTFAKAKQLISEKQFNQAVFLLDSIINSPGVRNSIMFESLDRRGACNKRLGNYALSIADYDRALSIPASEINKSIVTLNKCDLLIQMGRYSEAEKILDKIKDLSPNITYRRLSDIATIKLRTGAFAEAESIYKKLIENNTYSDKAAILQNLGFLYMTIGNWEDASNSLSEAIPLFKENSADKFIALSNLALTQAFNNNIEIGLTNINKSIECLSQLIGSNHPDVLIATRKRAEIYLKAKDYKNAEIDFQKYFIENRKEISRVFKDLTTQSRLDFWKKEKPLISLAFGLEENAPDLLFDIALFRRTMAMTGSNAENFDAFTIRGSDVRKKLKNDEAAIDFVVYPKRDSSGKIENNLGALIIKQLSTDFIKLGQLSNLNNHRIRNKKLVDAISSGNPDDINAIYADTTLSAKIWPFMPYLKNIQKVYFVPDGILNLLAVEYMPGIPQTLSINRLTNLCNLYNKMPKGSINSRSIKSSNSTNNLSSLLLVGGLDYDTLSEFNPIETETNHAAAEYLLSNFSEVSFRSLPGMKEEVERIHKLIPSANLIDVMPEERFKSEISSYKRLHVSSHGYTLHVEEESNPFLMSDSISADMSLLASGLVLSGANVAKDYKDRDDGLLSARELCDLNLKNMEFVALSACQTADGKVNDEGPAGLVRGLKNAGVKTIIATLWEVNDDAALMFMTKFYDLVNQGVKISEAFSKARNHIREYLLEEPELIAEFDPAIQSTRIVETGNIIKTYPLSSPAMWAPFILIDNLD